MSKRMGVILVFSVLVMTAGCKEKGTFVSVDDSAGPGTNEASANLAATPETCADQLRTEIHRPSFTAETGGPVPTTAQLEALRGETERLFRSLAGEMCAEGRIAPEAMGRFRRLIVQRGAGADNTSIHVGEHGRDTLVFQHVFAADEAGTPAAPDRADVREGLLCHFAREANARMCAERLP